MASSLFGDEQWDALRKNPETAELLADTDFKAILDEIRKNPTSLGMHASDPRIGKLFTALASSSASSMPATSASTTANKKEPASAPKPVEEDLSQLPEDERNRKLALRAKDAGNVEYKNRNFDGAIARYTEAVELDPDNVSFLTNRAAARLESGDVEGAIADCKLAVTRNMEKSLRTDFKIIARAYGRMGNAYLRQENYDEAIIAFQKSLLEYSDSKVQRSLSETQRLKKKRDEEAYINPELSKKEKDEGNVFFKAGNFPESIKKYTEAIKRNPKEAIPYSNRAAAYMKLGEFPMALKDCDRCLELDPKYVKAYIRKGNIHFFMKEYHKCLSVYEKGLVVDPNNRELLQGLMKTQNKIQEQQGSGQVDEKQVQQAMRDPEIQQIMSDPQINSVLRQMEQDPSYAAKAMRDPDVASKVQKLIAAGIIRTG